MVGFYLVCLTISGTRGADEQSTDFVSTSLMFTLSLVGRGGGSFRWETGRAHILHCNTIEATFFRN